MNNFITNLGAVAVVLGLIVNAVWTVANIRAENRIVRKLEDIREWIEDRYVCKADCDAVDCGRRLTRLEAREA